MTRGRWAPWASAWGVLALGVLVVAPSAVAAPPKPRFDYIDAAVAELVGRLTEKSGEKVVMVGTVTGSDEALIRSSLEAQLLAHGVQRANTKEEIEALREKYRAQGVDIYSNPEMQKLLRQSAGAKLTLELESACSPTADGGTHCDLWMRGFLPSTMVFAERASYVVPVVVPEEGPSPWEKIRLFLFLLVGYAFLPPLLHRIDVQARKLDGRWRSRWLLPVYLVGNRITVFLLVASFPFVAPYFFERWVASLPRTLPGIAKTTGIAVASMLVLHILGVLFVSLWRDQRHGGRYGATFRELCILHPHFWTRALEGRLEAAARRTSSLSGRLR